nr:DNA polymerase IV [Legionella jordanis]
MSPISAESAKRKIIHVDMDCFYAAIEIRDDPSLANKPVAIGGLASERGVLCTCNYIARNYGIHSAMPTALAMRKCPELVLLPVNMAKYRQTSQVIQGIFKEFTELVEPLSLDEAFLDVTASTLHQGSATWIAQAIRQKIWQAEQLTASAGVASNKFLAKIASGWQKPNGLFVIRPEEVLTFVSQLEVEQLFGVGKVTARKLKQMNLKTAADLQKISFHELVGHFGKLGEHLYYQCRGIDNRPVEPNRERKSLSVETTLSKDITNLDEARAILTELHAELVQRLEKSAANMAIKNQYVKLKFHNFKLVSAEIKSYKPELAIFLELFMKLMKEQQNPIRLLGLGVHFFSQEKENKPIQQSLF